MVWLEKAYTERLNTSILLRPRFDPLRSDARFQNLCNTLAGNAVEVLRHASFAACQGDKARLVSHFPTHVWDAAECQRRKSEGRTGTIAPGQV